MNRNRTQIMAQILELSQSQIRGTELARKTNVPTSRCAGLLQALTSAGLIHKIEKHWVITEKGRVYLDEYRKFYSLAESFGLEL
jgi:predicted transcriptional regulator